MHRYCGKVWSSDDIQQVRDLIALRPKANRADLSRLVCEALRWYRPNGKLKEMSCRVAMLRMQRDGLIELPAPTRHLPGKYKVIETTASDAEPDVYHDIRELTDLQLHIVTPGSKLRLWNEFVGRYHYLSYKMLPGAQLRYFIMNGERILGAMGFGASAWMVAPRDKFIGWTHAERERGLHLIVGQSRFLILPWVHCRNLASKTLAMVTERLPGDWREHYGFTPVLLETFVDTTRFRGTCYKASNWIHVGNTQGRGKLGNVKFHEPVKSIWLKPLSADFRLRLKSTS